MIINFCEIKKEKRAKYPIRIGMRVIINKKGEPEVRKRIHKKENIIGCVVDPEKNEISMYCYYVYKPKNYKHVLIVKRYK